MSVSRKTSWKLIIAGSTAVTAMVVHSVLKAGWLALNDEDPPDPPTSFDRKWKDALVWTTVLGVSVGLSQMIVKGIAAAGWQKVMKESPPQD